MYRCSSASWRGTCLCSSCWYVAWRICNMPLQVQMESLKPLNPGSASLQDAEMLQCSLPDNLRVAEAAIIAG